MQEGVLENYPVYGIIAKGRLFMCPFLYINIVSNVGYVLEH